MEKAGFFEVFYDILFRPVPLFGSVAERDVADETSEDASNRYMLYGALLVAAVSVMGPMLELIRKGGALGSLAYQVPLSAVGGVVLWLTMGGIVSLLAYAFTGSGRMKTFLILSAFSTLPWIFMAPSLLLRQGLGMPGSLISTLAVLGIWLWSVVLFALAAGKTYRLAADRVIILLLAPFAMFMVSIAWMAGFLGNLGFLF